MVRWFRGLLILLVLFASPLFFIGGPDWVSPEMIRQLWNFGHIVFFVTLTVLIQQYISLAHWSRWLVWSLLVFIGGVSIELIQGVIGREKSWQDVLYNLTGVWLGLFWFLRPTLSVWVGRCAAIALLVPALMKVWGAADNHWLMSRQMPVINNFETAAEIQQLYFKSAIVQLKQSENYSMNGKFSLAIKMNPADYSSIRMAIVDGDWRPYKNVKMSFFNPDQEPLMVTLRISDRQHDRGAGLYNDRFNQVITLNPGWNQVAIPMSQVETAPEHRPLNLGKVSSVDLFATGLSHSREFYWDYFHLE